MLRERALHHTVEMNHSVWQTVLFPVTKWSMDPLFLHNMHCSLWYVLGSKCLALSPWQPKAALHTVHPLTVFFFPFLFECYTRIFFNLISRGGVVSLKNSRLVPTANKRRGHFATLVLLQCSQILTVTPSLTHDMDTGISLERAWVSLESLSSVMEHKHQSFRSWNWNSWKCFTVPEVGLWLTSLVQIAPLSMWSENKKHTRIRKALCLPQTF